MNELKDSSTLQSLILKKKIDDIIIILSDADILCTLLVKKKNK